MKRRYRIAAVVAALCLLTACRMDVPAVKETLTPTMEKAYIQILADAMDEDVAMEVAVETISEEHPTQEITDANGDTVTFTVKKVDRDTLTMQVEFSAPLMHKGKKIREVTLGRDGRAVLKSPDGSFYYELTMDLPMSHSHSWSGVGIYDPDTAVVTYSGAGAMLWMDPMVLSEEVPQVYYMTTNGDPDRESRGTYTIKDNTLTLNEDVGLARLVFRRDEEKHAWRYDEGASARHTMSLSPLFADGAELSFAYAYEIGRGETYSYRVTDADGNTLLTDNHVDGFVDIEPLSPTRLLIRTHKPHTETKTRYLDTATGECSVTYTNVLAETAKEILWLDGTKLVIEEPLGEHKKQTPDVAKIVATSVSNASLTEDMITVEYTEVGGKQRIGAWNRQTGEAIEKPLLIVESGSPNHYREPFVYTLNENGDAFMVDPKASRECVVYDENYFFHYSGVNCAAIRMNGEYVDIADAMADGTLTVEGLEARVQADVQVGLATVEQREDIALTVYRYNGETSLHSVSFEALTNETLAYVGDPDAVEEYIYEKRI